MSMLPRLASQPSKPKLLLLARDFPLPADRESRLRTFNWILQFSKQFEVTLVSPRRRPLQQIHLDALEPYCREIHVPEMNVPVRGLFSLWARVRQEIRRFFHVGSFEALELQKGNVGCHVRKLMSENRYDVVFSDRWTWGREFLRRASSFSVLEWQKPQWLRPGWLDERPNYLLRAIRSRLQKSLKRQAANVLKGAGLVLVRDKDNQQNVLDLTAAEARSVIIPSGVDTSFYTPRKKAKDPRNIVFLGPLHTNTQEDALHYFITQLLPIVERRIGPVKVTVVDAVPKSSLVFDAAVEFTGPLPDTRFALWRSSCAVLPLRLGKGDRGRLAQLLSMGVPTIATPMAAKGLELVSGDGVLVAPDGADFAEAVAQVLTDRSLRDDLSRRGRETALLRFSMEATYERLSVVLRDAASHLQRTSF